MNTGGYWCHFLKRGTWEEKQVFLGEDYELSLGLGEMVGNNNKFGEMELSSHISCYHAT